MNKQPRALCALSLMAFLTLSGACAADGPATSLDAYGSPLPPGAIGRLGATRLRQACTCLAWAPDGKTFASAGADGSVRIWDASSGKQLRQIRKPGSYWLVTIAFTADGKYLIAGGVDGAVHILDAAADREVRIPAPPAQSASQRITALALHPREGTILTLCAASKLLLWDTTTGKIVHQEDVAPNKTLLACRIALAGRALLLRLGPARYVDGLPRQWQGTVPRAHAVHHGGRFRFFGGR